MPVLQRPGLVGNRCGVSRVAAALLDDALVVTLLPDSGERYLSKLNQKWMRERGLLD